MLKQLCITTILCSFFYLQTMDNSNNQEIKLTMQISELQKKVVEAQIKSIQKMITKEEERNIILEWATAVDQLRKMQLASYKNT